MLQIDITRLLLNCMKKPNIKKHHIISFFDRCDCLDHMVTRPLSHIRGNWELMWDFDSSKYLIEEDSYANILNDLIEELSEHLPPEEYHDHEDLLVENVIKDLGWDIKKIDGMWVGEDYDVMLEQGSFNDIQQNNLVLAAVGRIHAAIERNQMNFDEMELEHQKMLGNILTIILYHRTDYE